MDIDYVASAIGYLSLTAAAPDDVMASGPSSVTEGQPFQLTCSAIGWPLPSIAVSLFFLWPPVHIYTHPSCLAHFLII